MSTSSPETIASVMRRAAAAGTLWLDASGTSMGTSVVSGDKVLVGPALRPRQGEVWAFCNANSSIVVHRCRGRRREGWLFEGDAVGRADPVVSESWLIGRVISIRHDHAEHRVGLSDRVVGTAAIAARRARRVVRRTVRRALRSGTG